MKKNTCWLQETLLTWMTAPVGKPNLLLLSCQQIKEKRLKIFKKNDSLMKSYARKKAQLVRPRRI